MHAIIVINIRWLVFYWQFVYDLLSIDGKALLLDHNNLHTISLCFYMMIAVAQNGVGYVSKLMLSSLSTV